MSEFRDNYHAALTGYHCGRLKRVYEFSPRANRMLRKGMAHGLLNIHRYASKDEAYDDIRKSIQPQGIGSFILLSFFGGLISWVAQKIANHLWNTYRGNETDTTGMQALF